MEEKKKCTRLGCQKEYYEKDNVEGCCHYHDGKPIFHDIKKGWTCCNVVVYDWDESQKIPPCKTGKHTCDPNQKIEFFKSSTVANAQKAIDKDENGKKILNVNDYNKEQQKLEEEKKKAEGEKPKQIVMNKEGKYYCGNPGCQSMTYDPNDNPEGCCKHHLGHPVFHDRKKMWTCCKQEAYDWDDFQKLPPCAVGKHIPKYK